MHVCTFHTHAPKPHVIYFFRGAKNSTLQRAIVPGQYTHGLVEKYVYKKRTGSAGM